VQQGWRELIRFIAAQSSLAPEGAHQFSPLAADFHVRQTVHGEEGVHGMLPKGLLF